MHGLFSRYDRIFGKQFGTLAGLMLANFLCALVVMVNMDGMTSETKYYVQIGMIAFISFLSCLVLLRANRSRQVAEQALDTLAAKDKLTGLSNRESFWNRLSDRVTEGNQARPFALMLMDIDRFKELNAFLGYETADLLLQQFASRLVALCDHEKDVARLDGDEFAMIVSYDGSNPDLENRFRIVFERLYQSYMCNQQSVDLTLSIGVTLYPDDAVTAEILSQNAHFALQRAKQQGHDHICCYDEIADPQLMEEHFLSQDMDRALQQGEFQLYFQPQFCFHTGEHTGYEALLRWIHHERGMISPGKFIPIAEKNGLIIPLSDFVLRQACEVASRWVRPLKVAVNLSPVQMRHCEIADRVAQILDQTKLDPKRLELEVTESLFIDLNDQVKLDLERLQAQGVSVALDDFGTGYSSLAYLTGFPFNKIKIDQSFVRTLATDDTSMAIISAIIGLGKSLNMRITAEGIETQQAYELLRIAGCDEAQGFLLGKPRDIERVPGLEMEPIEALEAAVG